VHAVQQSINISLLLGPQQQTCLSILLQRVTSLHSFEPLILTSRLNSYDFFYFVSAAVAVESSHMTAPSSASWSRFSPPSNFVNGQVLTMWFMVCHWPQSQDVDWARPRLCKLARHGPWPVRKHHSSETMTREIETWLSDTGSRVDNNTVVHRRSRRTVLSPLSYRVRHVWPYWALRCKRWRCMLKDISTHRPIWTGFDDLKHIASCRSTTERRRWALAAMRAAWFTGSWKSGALHYEVVDEICVAVSGSSKEPRLMCGRCFRWQPMKYRRVLLPTMINYNT